MVIACGYRKFGNRIYTAGFISNSHWTITSYIDIFFTSIIYILIQTEKDTIQKYSHVNFNQLINEIKSQLNFSSVHLHLSLASQFYKWKDIVRIS